MLDPAMERTLVFTRTKHGADRVARHLENSKVPAASLHGTKYHIAPYRPLSAFPGGRHRVLVGHSIAARLHDVTGVVTVVNCEVPLLPDVSWSGSVHVCTALTHAPLVCRLLL